MRIGSVHALLVAAFFVIHASKARAQQPTDKEIQGTEQSETASQISTAPPQASPPQTPHRFWDRTNVLWFAGVGAARALDYASTLNLRRRGLDEILLTNSVVDNHPLFGGIEAASTAASIRVSYMFQPTCHHPRSTRASPVHFGV